MPPIVLDSERVAVNRFLDYRERQRQRLHAAEKSARDADARAKSGDGDIPRDSIEAALGRPLHHAEIIKRLHKLNPNLYFEKSNTTGRYGIYIHDSSAVGTPSASFVRYLGMSIAAGINPEFTPKLVNEKGDLQRIAAGYRTVLARLIRLRLVSFVGVEQQFGLVHSCNWKTLTT